jgi:hypothetical protein
MNTCMKPSNAGINDDKDSPAKRYLTISDQNDSQKEDRLLMMYNSLRQEKNQELINALNVFFPKNNFV